MGPVGGERVLLAGFTAQSGAGSLHRAGYGQASGGSPVGAARREECERRESGNAPIEIGDLDQSQPTIGACSQAAGCGLCSEPPGSHEPA